MPVDVTEDDIPFSFKIQYALIFGWIFLLFILSWISVAVVGRAIDNICFTSLGLSDKSTLHTCVIALVIVLIELLTLYYFQSLGIPIYDKIPGVNELNKGTTKTTTTSDVHLLDNMESITILANIEGLTII